MDIYLRTPHNLYVGVPSSLMVLVDKSIAFHTRGHILHAIHTVVLTQ